MWAAILILLALSVDAVNMDVQLLSERARVLSRHQPRTSACNTSVTYDKVLLKEMTLLSTYVFTGKVFGVNFAGQTRIYYKVIIRRVLKGDLSDIIGVNISFHRTKSLRFSGAKILVQSVKPFKCPPLRLRTYAIFLTERSHTELSLNLVMEPVLLSLRNIDIIEAAIKENVEEIKIYGHILEKSLKRRNFAQCYEKLRLTMTSSEAKNKVKKIKTVCLKCNQSLCMKCYKDT